MPRKSRPLVRRFEYRIVWKHSQHKGQKTHLAQIAKPILHRLLTLVTAEPWRGMTLTQLRKAWLRYSLLMDLPWESVEALPLREVARRMRDLYGPLDYVRVEFREVGQWVQMLDPIERLMESPVLKRSMIRQDALVAEVDAMARHTLDTWRMLPRVPETGAKVGRIRR